MIIPKTDIQVGNKIPYEHKCHAEHKLPIFKGQCKYIAQPQAGCLRRWIFDGTGLQHHIRDDQQKGKIPEEYNQIILNVYIIYRIHQKAAEHQHHRGKDRRQNLIQYKKVGAALVVPGKELCKPGSNTGAENRIDGICKEQNDRKPDKSRPRVYDK